MKNIFIIAVFSFLGLELSAQFHYTIKSEPDSAVVSLNGEKECITPCRVKYYWKDRKNKMIVFSVSAEGYDTWTDTILEKPKNFDKNSGTLELKPTVSKLEFDSINPLIAFDKLLAVFEDGQQVGIFTDKEGKSEPIKWEGSVKLGNSAFEKTFYRRMTDYGFETPIRKNSKLFSEDENQRFLPKYVIGAQIVDYNVQVNETDKKSYGAGKLAVKITLKIEWKVFDKSTDKVVYSFVNEGIFHNRESYSTSGKDIAVNAFEMSLIDFVEKSEFYELVRSTKEMTSSNISEVTENEELIIPSVKNPEFTKLSEMIQHSNRSCVTIITDAGHGSGVIVSEDGYIITAYHVVQDVNKIKIKMSTGIELGAQLISSNFENDVALLKMEGAGFQPLSISDEQMGLGEEVITIGTPADIELGQSVSKGMISGKREIEGQEYIQIDISVSPGNSGGPLLNDQGEIVGIVQRKLIGSGVEGIGFAIPIQKALQFLSITLK